VVDESDADVAGTTDASKPTFAMERVLASLCAEERILWAAESFADAMVLLSSMQRTAVVLMHMFHTLGLSNEILFVDTGYHFCETLRLRDEYMRRYRLNLVTLYPDITTEDQESRHGKKLFACTDGQPECCHLRKVAPLLSYLKAKGKAVVVNGLRRGEGGRRGRIEVITPDPRTGGYQLSPLVDWAEDQVRAYVAKHALPVHPLHARGYPSIGCYPCTTPVKPGEGPRAGRWRHLRPADSDAGPQYCDINYTDGGGI
jgi:phosphoadenosine phosphosulfate reductase